MRRFAILLATLSFGCAAQTERTSSFGDVAPAKRRANVPAIVALMPDIPSARATYNGIVDELGEDFDVLPRIVDASATPETISGIFDADRPQAVVLMNNPTLRLYRQFQGVARPEQRKIPAVAVLTSFLRETSVGVQNLAGVIYEVPLVTSLVNLRLLLNQPLKRIGVLHRPSFAPFLEEQRRLCAKEGFEVIGVEVSGDSRSQIRNGLTRLREDDSVDAIWVLNDNALLDRDLLLRGWLPGLRRNKTPVVVNVSSLLSKKIEFGTFAVLPDHRALGTQAAQMIIAISEDDWNVANGEFEYPLSVEKVLDLEFARRNLKLAEPQLATVDRLVE